MLAWCKIHSYDDPKKKMMDLVRCYENHTIPHVSKAIAAIRENIKGWGTYPMDSQTAQNERASMISESLFL